MSRDRHRILVDLSPAAGGFAGIPQEARLLLQSLWRNPAVDPSGLIFTNDLSVMRHRFPKADGHLAERVASHAQYLFAVAQAEPGYASFAPLRWLQKARMALRCLLGRSADMSRIDNGRHGESVWRLLLSQSLGASGLELARSCPMYLANLSRKALKLRSVTGLPAISLDTRDYDFFLLHDAAPVRLDPQTCLLIRYYDMIPALRPELVGSHNQIRTNLRGLSRCHRQNAVVVCCSEPTRADVLEVFPELEERTVTIPAGLGKDLFCEKQPHMVSSILRSRLAAGSVDAPSHHQGDSHSPYLMLVATIEPRKNHLQLIRAYETLARSHSTDLSLVFVGSLGWGTKDIARAMQPLQRTGRLIHLERVPPEELRILYSHAEAIVFPSFYEGFGYCPLEAMQCGTPAIVSDIPSHRWVCGDAALYCDPFETSSLVKALERLVIHKEPGLREQLVMRGESCVRRYASEVIGTKWQRLCDEIRRQGGGANAANLKLAKLSLHDVEPARIAKAA